MKIQREEGENFAGLLEGVGAPARGLAGSGAPSSSRRSHPSPPCRLVSEEERPRVGRVVEEIADHPDEQR